MADFNYLHRLSPATFVPQNCASLRAPVANPGTNTQSTFVGLGTPLPYVPPSVDTKSLYVFNCARKLVGEWWVASVVIYLERGADLHVAQLMPLPLTCRLLQ